MILKYRTDNNTPISKFILDIAQSEINNIDIFDCYNYPNDLDIFSTIIKFYPFLSEDMIHIRFGTDGVIKDSLCKYSNKSIYYREPNYGMVKEYCNQFHLLKTDYDKSDIVYISNPNPSNGDRISDEYLINEIEKYNKFFIIDLAYDIYVKETISDHIDLVSKLMKYNNVLVLISFSKMTGLSGCRVGIGLTNSKNILTIRQPWNISSINIQLFKKIFRYSTISTHQSIIKESMKSFIIEQGLNVSKFSCPIVMLKHDIKSPTRFYPEYNEFRYSVIDTKLL